MSRHSLRRVTGATDAEVGTEHESQTVISGARWGISLTHWKYLQLFSGFLMNTLSWGIVTSFGTFLDLYDGILGESFSDALLSMVGGTQVLLVLSWAVINGRLVDAGHHRWIMLWGLVILPLSFGFLSHFGPMAKYWMIWLFGGFGVGWGTACFGLLGPLNISQVHGPEKISRERDLLIRNIVVSGEKYDTRRNCLCWRCLGYVTLGANLTRLTQLFCRRRHLSLGPQETRRPQRLCTRYGAICGDCCDRRSLCRCDDKAEPRV